MVMKRKTKTRAPVVVYLREIDSGTDNACWVVCNRIDPGAVPFKATE